ncbi:MAG: amino acid ABC transporter substrate-binding protein, partial [Rhodospirillales bacterium]|nr:amino acid ABC transporter substrate-binding protein [Rhodospirillales bacterium]
STNDPEVKRLLGGEGEYGARLGLSNDWAMNIIKQVGNYGESYERNIGPNTPVKLARGVNGPWNKGGILYSPPFR